jgi:uncharacterized protein YgbK (DUF1537 family)
MRYLILAALLAAGSAVAEGQGLADPAKKELSEIVAQKCKESCYIFSQEDVQSLEDRINAAIERARAEGFAAGKADANERCRNRI